MNIELILIGDELLIGQVNDTNSVWLGKKLSEMGVNIQAKHTIHDSREAILNTVRAALNTADGLIITGGLGPTNDDVTKKVLAEYFGAKEWREDQESLNIITDILGRRSIPLTELNRAQAWVPDVCEVFPNHFGTAPGMLFNKEGKFVISLPGVPWEMEGIMKEFGLPWIKAHASLPSCVHRTVLIQGIPESILAERISAWEAALEPYMALAYLPNPDGVRLRISAMIESNLVSQNLLELQVIHRFEALKEILGDAYMGLDYSSLEESIAAHLFREGQTIATAESCTAGGIAATLCKIPGASRYFKGSIVAYSNDVKINQLQVSEESLRLYGAVSLEVVMQMAKSIREHMHTDYGVATSGIAGPDGGSEEKPVGTLWVAIATPTATFSRKFVFGRSRTYNTQRFIAAALQELRSHLYNSPQSAKLL